MIGELEFERPITDLRKKIDELREITEEADVDLSAERKKYFIYIPPTEQKLVNACSYYYTASAVFDLTFAMVSVSPIGDPLGGD